MNHATLKSYLLGFILSLALTLAAFILVINNLLDGKSLTFVILGLALIQLWVQLIFFLHLNHERSPRWNLTFFVSTIGIVLIIVAGSLWIMNNLNYHMTPEATGEQIFQDEGIPK